MRHRLDSTAQPQLSEPSSESNDSLNIIENERTIATIATVLSAVIGEGGEIADAINFGADVLERIEHDNQSHSNGERVGCAVVGELARYTTLAIGEGASLYAAARTGRSWGASNPAATAVCSTHELVVTTIGIATTIEIANSVGDSAERLCHTIVQAPSIPPSFPRPSPSHSNSSITLLDYVPTSLPIRTTFNTQRENSIPSRELSLFGERVAVPRVTGSYSQVLQRLHPGASSTLSLNREFADTTSRTHAAASTRNTTALPLDNQLSRERSTTSSTSLIAQRLNTSSASASQMYLGDVCRSYTTMASDNNNALHQLNILQERTTPQLFHHDHDAFRVQPSTIHSHYCNDSQRQLYSDCGEFSFFMSEKPTQDGGDRGSEKGDDCTSDDRSCNYDNCDSRDCRTDNCNDSNSGMCSGERFW